MKKNSFIKLSIVGCGAITRVSHLPAVLKNSNFRLDALVDKDLDSAKKLVKAFGIDTFICDSVIKMPPVDASIVAVPPHLHAKVSIELMERGIHVLCEKPIATNIDDAETMLKTAATKQVVLLVGANAMFYPSTTLLLDLLRDNYLGEIIGIYLESGVRSNWDSSNPLRFNPAFVPGGVLYENGIHWIYRLIHWFGYPDLIRFADDRIDGVEANAQIECVFNEYGKKIISRMYFSNSHSLKNKLIVHGTNASAEIYEKDIRSVYVKKIVNGSQKVFQTRNFDDNGIDSAIEEQLKYFAEIITRKQKVPNQTEYAFKALKFIEECYSHRVDIDQPWVFQL